MTDCPRIGRLFGGCKWSPRYDLGPAVLPSVRELNVEHPGYLEKMRPKTYVRDVCERCGKTIERAGQRAEVAQAPPRAA